MAADSGGCMADPSRVQGPGGPESATMWDSSSASPYLAAHLFLGRHGRTHRRLRHRGIRLHLPVSDTERPLLLSSALSHSCPLQCHKVSGKEPTNL